MRLIDRFKNRISEVAINDHELSKDMKELTIGIYLPEDKEATEVTAQVADIIDTWGDDWTEFCDDYTDHNGEHVQVSGTAYQANRYGFRKWYEDVATEADVKTILVAMLHSNAILKFKTEFPYQVETVNEVAA